MAKKKPDTDVTQEPTFDSERALPTAQERQERARQLAREAIRANENEIMTDLHNTIAKMDGLIKLKDAIWNVMNHNTLELMTINGTRYRITVQTVQRNRK